MGVDVVSIAYNIMNRVFIRSIIKWIPCELYKGRISDISHLHVFRYKYFIFNNGKDDLKKFDAKDDEGIFIEYSTSNKAFKVFTKITLTIEESIHVNFDETIPKPLEVEIIDYADILEKINLEEKDQEVKQGQIQNQVLDQEPVQDLNVDIPPCY